MPIYEYRCQDCNHLFEEWHRGYEEKEIACPACSGVAKRLISNTAFILKGSGWYVTDYARNQDSKGTEDGNGNGKSQEQTASSSQEGGASKEQSTSQASAESGSGNGSSKSADSGEKSGSKAEGDSKSTGQTPPKSNTD